MRENEDAELESEVRRGQEAERLLNSPILQEALTKMEEGVIQGFKQCPLRDDEGLKNLRVMLKVIDDFKHRLKTVLETGKLAKIQVTEGEQQIL